MVKFLKPNKAVILLQGRFAGRKAVIVRNFDDGTREREYGHCLVTGIAKYPRKVIRRDSAKKTAKKSRVKAFLKVVNYSHTMPVRYTLDVDLNDVITVDALKNNDAKVTASKEVKSRFEERFKTGKNRWFFTKLRMDSKNINLNVPYKECWHKMRAPVARSNTSRNPGRLFWGCPLWKTNNCHYFRWLPEDASRAYMKVHGLEGVEIVDTADILE